MRTAPLPSSTLPGPTRVLPGAGAAAARPDTRADILDAAAGRLNRGRAGEVTVLSIARELGLAPSAVHRHFASREDLITGVLARDYSALGAALARAEGARPREDLAGRAEALFLAERFWALGNPDSWTRLYGTPVTGYVAPGELLGPASAFFGLLEGVFDDATALGRCPAQAPAGAVETGNGAVASAQKIAGGAPSWLVATAFAAWSWMVGTISAELFGHLAGVVDNCEALYRATTKVWLGQLGLTAGS